MTPSQHAALLKDRHTSGFLAQLVPIPQFADADFLLYLRGQLQGDEPSGMRWLPWGTSQVYHPPRYLLQASNTRYAQQLLRPLGVDDIESLKQRLVRVCQPTYPFNNWLWVNPLRTFDPQTIASR